MDNEVFRDKRGPQAGIRHKKYWLQQELLCSPPNLNTFSETWNYKMTAQKNESQDEVLYLGERP